MDVRRRLSMMQATAAAQAIIFGTRVSDAIASERQEICQACPYIRTDKSDQRYCGICGCNISRPNNRLLNLVVYEEKLPKWGCKHPLRSKGHGWKR